MPAIADTTKSSKSSPRVHPKTPSPYPLPPWGRGVLGRTPKTAKVSRTSKPESMTVREWQLQLRRQFGREQEKEFDIRNLGREPVFSEFAVTNPATKRTYRAVIRGLEAGVNYCSCPDYSVNTLGTCKHIECRPG